MKQMLLAMTAVLPLLAGTSGLPRFDPGLQESLQEGVARLGLTALADQHRLSVSLLDLSDPDAERYASFNDRQTMYAASLPKIGVLLGVFQAIRDGLMGYTPAVDVSLTRMVRQSSNDDASRLIQRLGYDFIARTLASPRYRLYDPAAAGGLWIGKAYGPSGMRRHVEFWRPEPISGEWHAANSLQLARFFWMLHRGELVSPAHSASMKRILAGPASGGEYFVEGLRTLGVRHIYRKFGTYADTHCDAALVEHQGRRYVAAVMVNDSRGASILPRLIRELHRIVFTGRT
jgi:beta-lactamase class A